MAGISPYVGVRFHGGDLTVYSYRNHIPGLMIGEFAVVETPDGQFKVVTVVEINLGKKRRKLATKWLVDRIELDKYRALSAPVPPPKEDD